MAKTKTLAFALVEKETGFFVGQIALHLIRCNCVYNIEYFIAPQYRGKGYATEALTKLIEEAKNNHLYILKDTIREGVCKKITPDIKCIEAHILSDNTKSSNVVKKCGFQYAGNIPYYCQIGEKYYHFDFYDLMISK